VRAPDEDENPDNSDFLREDDLQLPSRLDEHSIEKDLHMISRTNPQQLPTTVRAIREKWAYSVGGWAERGRLDYLEIVLKQLDVSNAILLRCLSMEEEWGNHQEKKARRAARASHRIHELEAEAEAEAQRKRIEEAKTGQAEARKKRQDLESPPQPSKEMTADERRKQKFKNADEEVNRLVARKAKVLSDYLEGKRFEELSEAEQDEYRADENMYNDRIRQSKEKRMQYE
jgi:hypothetical protein